MSQKKEVASDIRHIFNAPNDEEANRLLKSTISKYEKSAPKLSEWLEVSIPEGLQVFGAAVLVVQVVRVLPDINAEERRADDFGNAFHQRVVLVWRAADHQ